MSKNILLIEDEHNIVEAMRFLLSREGWHVDTHSDGATAMDAVRSIQPDLVVLDYMLPGRSGIEILADMRAVPEFAKLPVLMLTAKGQLRDREQAERAGANRFMTKPFSNAEVVKAVRDLAHTPSK